MARTTEQWEAHLGAQVRAERMRRDLTQAQLARAANVSAPSISALENGAGSRLATVIAVARALDREPWLEDFAALGDVSPLAMLRASQSAEPPRRRARGTGSV